MPAATPVEIDSARVEELTARELQVLNERTATSERMYGRASKALSAGVASSYQLRDPWPI
jgi:glutamate-1-semialdehyde 2,1-aminomutase